MEILTFTGDKDKINPMEWFKKAKEDSKTPFREILHFYDEDKERRWIIDKDIRRNMTWEIFEELF
jgi:hypothetical protein